MSLLLSLDAAGSIDVNATKQTLVLTTYPANISAGIEIQTGTAALVLTQHPATVSLDINVNATSQTLVLTQYPATVDTSVAVDVLATSQAFVLTTYPASVSLDINVQANAQALVLTTYPATVYAPIAINEQVYSGGWEAYLRQDKKRRQILSDQEDLEKEIAQQKQVIEKEQNRLKSKQREIKSGDILNEQIAALNRSIRSSEILIDRLQDGLVKLLVLKHLEAEQFEKEQIRIKRRNTSLMLLLHAA